MRKFLHIIVLLAVILLWGCTAERDFAYGDGARFSLKVRCDNGLMPVKTPQDGEQSFNENLIQSVDFLFYPGASPSADADAVFHIRKQLSRDSMTPGNWFDFRKYRVKWRGRDVGGRRWMVITVSGGDCNIRSWRSIEGGGK